MTPRELASLAKALGGVIREHVSKAVGDLSTKLAELEQKVAAIPAGERGVDGINGKDGAAGERGADGINGKDGAPGERGVDGINGKDGAPGERGADGINGKDGIPGERGADGINGKDGIPGERGVDGINGKDGAPGERGADGINGKDGVDGKSITAEDVLPTVKQWFEALPIPADGKDGRDGIDGKSITVDDVATFMESQMAKWALDFERRAQDTLQRCADRIPAPQNGKDGLGFDDMEVAYDGERSITLRFVRGEQKKEFTFEVPTVIDRRVYRAGDKYKRFDGVTFGGSFWIAQKDTTQKPGDGDEWRLAVKKGRDLTK